MIPANFIFEIRWHFKIREVNFYNIVKIRKIFSLCIVLPDGSALRPALLPPK